MTSKSFIPVAVLLAVSLSADAVAQTVRVRTNTLARGTQLRRSDLTRDAERFFSQSVSIWGWDALPMAPGTVDAHASARYVDDFGIAAEDRRNPFVQTERSRFIVDVAQVRYRPVSAVTVVGGRQWVPSTLGMRDIDGGRLRLSPELSRDVRAWVDAFAGQEVASGWATIASDAWDVQGLAIDEYGASPGGLRVGTEAGVAVGTARLSAAWQRRTHRADDAGERAIGDERLGIAVSGNVHRLVAVSASASYHTLIDIVDRADFHVSWRDPWLESALSVGAEHRRPWFDTSSIFNVFGARPLQGVYATWQVPVSPLNTTVEARTWARVYDANLDVTDVGGGEDDARAFGAGLGHRTAFRAFDRRWTWRSYLSGQTSPGGAQGGTQLVGDTAVEFPAIRDLLSVEGRFLGLLVEPGQTSAWRGGNAFTTVFGLLVPTTFGSFRVQVEGQSSNFYGANLNLYASFGTEMWL